MNAVPGSSRRRYAAVLSIFVVVATVLAAGATCDDGYQLTISSTTGGSVTVPGEGTRSYGDGTVVELVAVPDEGHGFRRWTGDTAQMANPYSASTSITVNGDYSIVATFGSEDDTDRDRPVDPP